MAENRSVNVVNGKLSMIQTGVPKDFLGRHRSALASQIHTHFEQTQVDYNAIAASLAGAEPQNFCDLIDKTAVDRLAEMGIKHGNMQLPQRDLGYDNLEAPATDLSEPVVPMTFGAPEPTC